MSKAKLAALGRQWNENIDVKLRNWFPVTVWYNIDAPDEQVGYRGGISEYSITTHNGSSIGWLKVSQDDIDELIERIEAEHGF